MPAKKRSHKTIPELPEESEIPDTGSQDEIPDTGSQDEIPDTPRNDPSEDEDPAAELLRLRQALAEAQEHIAALQRASITPVAEPVREPIREPKVNKSPEFHGKLSEYETFISQCTLTFTLCPHTYRKDEQKVLFVVSYLRGNARDWARPILRDPQHRLRNDFTSFKEALDNIYADRNIKQKAMDKLGALAQTKSCAAYAAEFEHVVAPLNLDPDSKRTMFYKGLDPNIKKALVYFPEAEDFDEFLKQCISVDQRLFHLRREEKSIAKSAKFPSKRPHEDSKLPDTSSKKPYVASSSGNSANSGTRQPSAPASSRTFKPKPKFNGPRPAISDEERERRRLEKLCYRCASPAHMANDCPLGKTNSSNVTVTGPAPEYFPRIASPGILPENGLSQVGLRPVP